MKNATYSSHNDYLTIVVGTYTYDTSRGIYSFRFNQKTGEHTALCCADVENPSYLAFSTHSNIVYSITEKGNESKINAHRFNIITGSFSFINSAPTENDPCHINILPNGLLCTANYSDGSISLFQTTSNGSIISHHKVIPFYAPTGPDTQRQKGVHIHFTQVSPDKKYLFINDLGTDRIHCIDLTANMQRLPDTIAPPGYGPRHSIFSHDGKHLYLINELSGHILVYLYDNRNGSLKEIQDIPATEINGHGSADITISPDGKFLYASHRLINDGISIFQITQNGILKRIGYVLTGKHPRNFAITHNGKFILVACRDDNEIQIFVRDISTGLFSDTGKRILVPRPVCIKFTTI